MDGLDGVIKDLLEEPPEWRQRADVTAVNHQGETALMVADKLGKRDNTAILQAALDGGNVQDQVERKDAIYLPGEGSPDEDSGAVVIDLTGE